MEFLAGDMNLAPGAHGYLASGTAVYNVVNFEPKVETAGSAYILRTGKTKIEGIPKIKGDFKNQWDVKLADTPMSLSIHAGPYTGSFELGGLALQKLLIDEVGSDVKIAFSTPNQVEMSLFNYTTGGSKMVLKGLANANFA